MDSIPGLAGAAKEELMQLVRFAGSQQTPLAGWLHPSEGTARGALLLAHCFTCSKDLTLYKQLAQALAAEGLAVLRFDFSGIGQSEGDFSRTTLPGNVEDLRLAAAELQRLLPGPPLGLVGHSLGGTATLLAANTLPAAQAVAVMGTSSDPVGLRRLLAPQLEATSKGVYQLKVGGRRFSLRQEFFASLEAVDLLGEVRRLSCPLLVIHGDADRLLDLEQGKTIYQAAAEPKRFAAVEGGDHLFSQPAHRQQVARELSRFFEDYL